MRIITSRIVHMLRHFREKSANCINSADRKLGGDLCGCETHSTSIQALLYVSTYTIFIRSSWFDLSATNVRILALPFVPWHLWRIRGNMDLYKWTQFITRALSYQLLSIDDLHWKCLALYQHLICLWRGLYRQISTWTLLCQYVAACTDCMHFIHKCQAYNQQHPISS